MTCSAGDRAGEQPVEPAGPQRDAVTSLGYAALGTWAWFLYGFGAILPLLRAEQDTSRTVMGMHSFAMALGGLVSGSLTVPLVRRLRRRGVFPLGGVFVAVGVLGLALGHSPLVTLAGCFVTGIGGTMFLNSTVPALADHHGRSGPAVISEANAVAAGIGLVAPLAVGTSVRFGWTWRPAALVVVVLIGGMLLLLRRVPPGTPALDAVLPPHDQHADGRLPASFWVFMALVMACVGIEFCCTAWSADLLRQRTELSPGAASAGLAAIVGGMAAGRVAVGRLAVRRRPQRLLLYALGLSIAGWAITWTATAPGPALAGLAVLGLGLAGQYPLGAALAMTAARGRTDAASGRLSLGVSVASGVTPFTLGAVADATSTHAAFVAVPLLIALAGATLLLAGRLAPARAWLPLAPGGPPAREGAPAAPTPRPPPQQHQGRQDGGEHPDRGEGGPDGRRTRPAAGPAGVPVPGSGVSGPGPGGYRTPDGGRRPGARRARGGRRRAGRPARQRHPHVVRQPDAPHRLVAALRPDEHGARIEQGQALALPLPRQPQHGERLQRASGDGVGDRWQDGEFAVGAQQRVAARSHHAVGHEGERHGGDPDEGGRAGRPRAAARARAVRARRRPADHGSRSERAAVRYRPICGTWCPVML